MNKDSLREKLTSIQQQFDADTQQKTNAEAEIYRLQGEYRLVTDLINESEPSEVPKETKKVGK